MKFVIVLSALIENHISNFAPCSKYLVEDNFRGSMFKDYQYIQKINSNLDCSQVLIVMSEAVSYFRRSCGTTDNNCRVCSSLAITYPRNTYIDRTPYGFFLAYPKYFLPDTLLKVVEIG